MLWCRSKVRNTAESGERSVLTLGSLYLPCCRRDTAWSWFNFHFKYIRKNGTVKWVTGFRIQSSHLNTKVLRTYNYIRIDSHNDRQDYLEMKDIHLRPSWRSGKGLPCDCKRDGVRFPLRGIKYFLLFISSLWWQGKVRRWVLPLNKWNASKLKNHQKCANVIRYDVLFLSFGVG